MEKIYKVAIIGGGASGLTAGIMLSSVFSGEVVVLERLPRVGKKITVTGNGRGNVTNKRLSAQSYHSLCGDGASFVAEGITLFNNESVCALLRSLGMAISCDGDKVYPSSFQASSVLDLMRAKLDSLKCEVRTEFNAVKIKKGKVFSVISDGGERVLCERVIIAVGGKCQKQLGTDGTGYALAEGLGHSVTALYPSLVQLKTEASDIKALKGIRQEVTLSLYSGSIKVAEERGDVIFTDCGVSGDAAFRISSRVPALKDPVLSVGFMPDHTEEELAAMLYDKLKNACYLPAEDLLTGYVNKQVGRAILKRAGVDVSKKCPISHINAVISVLKGFRLKVEGSLGFNYAQVTRGGINIDEVDPGTMQSRIVEGLYLTGEVLDVDGDCGGYNLQWAFSSAYLAAKSIAEQEQ